MASLLDSGRKALGSKKYKAAIEAFTRAMHACPCNRGAKRPRCECKDFVGASSATDRPSPIFHEAMYTCSCNAKQFSKCNVAEHISALDLRVAAFEQIGELGRAQRDAGWLLEIAPRRLEGYLRLGKVARMQGDKIFAWRAWSEGIDVGRKNNMGADPRLAKLYELRQPLHKQFHRQDPMSLPTELVEQILAYLSLHDLLQCLRLSKQWNRYLNSGSGAWDYIRILASRQPSQRALRSIVLRSKDMVRVMEVEVCYDAKDDQYQSLIIASRNVRWLMIHSASRSVPFSLSKAPSWAFGRLSRLTAFGVQETFLLELLKRNANGLEELATIAPMLADAWRGIGTLDKLKRLSLIARNVSGVIFDDIDSICKATPNLTSLDLARMAFADSNQGDAPRWANLDTVRLNCCVNLDKLPLQTSNLKRVELVYFSLAWEELLPQFRSESLEVFQLTTKRAAISREIYEDIRSRVTPSVRSGTLREFSVHRLDFELHDLDWLAGCASLTSLGLDDLLLAGASRTSCDRLVELVNSFPNLASFSVLCPSEGPQTEAMLAVALDRIMAKGRVKTITQAFTGMLLDRLRETAASFGVKLKFGVHAA